jgi:predicted DCC family thiol-disulfide oxidoreductase YuxK
MNKSVLIYDPTCPFCISLANRLKTLYGVEIMPNDSKDLPDYVDKTAVKRDVHYYIQYRKSNLTVIAFKGAEAAIEILSIKHSVLASFCRLPIIKHAIEALYYIVKKSRKYL